jgi:hypothetical protein
MWSRVHKVDRIRPQPNGGAIILIEDERGVPGMSRVPALSTLIAIARVLDAKQVLEAKYGGKGEVRYAPAAFLPGFMSEAIARAGGHIADRTGDNIVQMAQPASVSAIVDAADLATTLRHVEADRRKAPMDQDNPLYWPAVFELASLAGEMSRARGGRWIEIKEMPVPFALKFPEGTALAHPTTLARKIVEGSDTEGSLATP